MTPRPNVLFITADQWRGDCLGVAGHPVVSTPTLDRLATEGVWFRKHYAQCAPCGPSRASLHTGTYLHTHRSVFNGTPLSDRFTNTARVARGVGYTPTLFGYTDTTLDPALYPADDVRLRTYEEVLPGFTVGSVPGELATPWLEWLTAQGVDCTGGQWAVRESMAGDPRAQGRGSTFAPPRFDVEQTEAAYLTGLALDHIEASGDGWFVHLSYLAPHPPFAVPEPYNSMFDPADVPSPVRHRDIETEGGAHPFVASALGLMAAPASEREQRQTQATYYGMMAEVDAQIARLLDTLSERGELDNTLVIFTSDHGEMMGDHWLTSKLGFFDQAYHVPLIIWTPSGCALDSVDEFTENVDILPTIVEFIGAPIPSQCEGRSLLPFVAGETPLQWRTDVHWEFDYRGIFGGASAARSAGFSLDECCLAVVADDAGKYVHFGGLPPVFYDRREDPAELSNRAGDPSVAGAVLEYSQKMLDWKLTAIDQTYANLLAGPDGIADLTTL